MDKPSACPHAHGPNYDTVPFKSAKEAVITEFERGYLKALVDWSGGNVSKAARKARMDRMYLCRLPQHYELRGASPSGTDPKPLLALVAASPSPRTGPTAADPRRRCPVTQAPSVARWRRSGTPKAC